MDEPTSVESIYGEWLQALDERTKAVRSELVALRAALIVVALVVMFAAGLAVRARPANEEGGRP